MHNMLFWHLHTGCGGPSGSQEVSICYCIPGCGEKLFQRLNVQCPLERRGEKEKGDRRLVGLTDLQKLKCHLKLQQIALDKLPGYWPAAGSDCPRMHGKKSRRRRVWKLGELQKRTLCIGSPENQLSSFWSDIQTAKASDSDSDDEHFWMLDSKK